ncbi:Carbonic anhydrase- protein 10 [Desmophyllum pertusum]|uniref:Carbonic anhydrase- protein 10 n=1 Tax=Desmophyllum pertusum TaxID=174260 RepID=A0A9X0CJP8_9CNID|nr:Carbonic anhydrase- protein 10 [Desmophyllum pertusum]
MHFKRSLTLTLVLCTVVAFHLETAVVQATELGDTPWTYDRLIPGAKGPDEWETLNGNWSCNGRKQSPINVITDQVMQNDPTNPPNLRLTVAGNKPITGELRNNGYAPTFFIGEELTVKLAGGLLQESYFLKQFHFHFGCNDTVGSEHTIDGNTYPIELPMANSSTSPANIALEKIAQLLNNVVDENGNHVVTQSAGIHIEDFAPLLVSPDVADRFYKYKGSLTTPGCYESVTWFVMNNHPQITEKEILAFRNLKSSKAHVQGPNAGRMCNNFRNTMPLNGRQIHSNIVLS